MSAPVDPWMCRACSNAPVGALGETLCATCTAQASAPQDVIASAIESAQAFLEGSDAATDDQPDKAIALALQGILVCQIELMAASAAASPMPPGTIMLPEESELAPQRGPKAWGQ